MRPQIPTTPPRLSSLILLTGLSTLSLNMFLPALAEIAADLDAEYGTMTLAVSGYLALTAAVQLAVGSLADRYGRRPTLLLSLAVFTVASAGCALAESAAVFLLCRAAQAAVVGGYVVSLAIVRDVTAERAVAGRLATIASAMALAPIAGPLVGGALAAALDWRAVFWAYALAGAAAAAVCWLDVGETKPAEEARRSGGASGIGGVVALLREPRFLAHASCAA
ncbi:MAG: MFS transporter, partial [Pseudomonadota bacterium]